MVLLSITLHAAAAFGPAHHALRSIGRHGVKQGSRNRMPIHKHYFREGVIDTDADRTVAAKKGPNTAMQQAQVRRSNANSSNDSSAMIKNYQVPENINNIRINNIRNGKRTEINPKEPTLDAANQVNDNQVNGANKLINSDINSKSAQRLLKAKRLLEMAQVSPSQRLEMEEARKSSQSATANRAFNSTNGNDMNDDSTVVAMGSYSMRFGGYGSLEEELEQQGVYELRMADTFDSVDNPVDSKSLLPGGRWVNTNSGHNGVAVSGNVDGSFLPDKKGEQGATLNRSFSSDMEQPSRQVAEPLVRYDPIAAEKLLFLQPAKWLVRNVQIAFPFGFWLAGVVLDTVLGCEKPNRTHRAKQLNSIIASLGPAIIKAGQALASRPDLLPSEYLNELQKLQDDVPTFNNDIAFRIVEEELKQKFGGVFELVEPEPVAAASIGQVYKGRLLKNGQTVAIKIQRPNTEEIVALDLYVLRWWGGVYNGIFRLLGRDIDLQSVMDDFGNLLYAEIDYVAEAANARRFSELYAQDVAIADVFVPKVYSELTTRKVLTMEWVDGFRLTDRENLEAYNLDREKLVDTLVQCSLRQIMENGFFHADPHAGNLLATKEGRLCYLDFGMMSYAAAAQRNGFLLAVVHIVNRDWGELVRVYQKLGFIPDGTDVKPIEDALEAALPDVLNTDISELNFKNVVGKLGDIMYTYPFSLPPFYISIIRCLGVLEGLAIQVDPKARIISEAYPYVANRVLTDDSQEELREALRRLIFTTDGHIRWSRLESLLDEAKESSGFDVVLAIDKLVDYVISSEGEDFLNDIADQIVVEADSLGHDTLIYITKAASALAIQDERGAAKALRSFVELLQNNVDEQSEEQGAGQDSPSPVTTGIAKLIDSITETLPEPTPVMQRTWKIGLLLGTQGASSLTASTKNSNAAVSTISKFIPLVRKLSQEPRVTSKANEVVARLGERLVSRGLRAAFGLAPPVFETAESG
eukprot:CAMPEP_0172544070 /NCGR_PEP_ID=MMETSP1067-20121228/14306_1 /TAXON_ID=265564 ORGANISM="Thalassiosira punctigera, Strain Tpunct2005C2" /NCGR_SAMPLE_ID=MMETSP1067 /ASSEMBLY_ACC=CAM_ASM_000444 /LENGTH=978 /DNA_ID=CAMNT_0013330569 /DNA_START=63 /DNA_END=2999 /DNA_ORIENTATION=-